MGIFSLDPGLAVWTWVSFGLLLFGLSKFAYPTLLRNIKDREKAISDAVDNADAIKERLKSIEVEHETILAEARKKSDGILRQTREDADKLKRELYEKAENEAAAVLEEAKRRISEERDIAIESMKKEMINLICESSEKLVQRSFLKDDDKLLVKELVDEL